MTSLPTKRKHGSFTNPETQSDAAGGGCIPVGDLTRDRMHEFLDTTALTDRQRMSWALQTEARVRLAKLKARGNPSAVSHTMDSEFLFDVYPNVTEPPKHSRPDGIPPEHWKAWHRPCHEAFRSFREVDDSFDVLPKLDMNHHQMDDNALINKATGSVSLYSPAPLPPNLLCVQLILKAYLGYAPAKEIFHSKNPDLPRCALQGGAVVAALTAWRDARLPGFFEQAKLHVYFDDSEQERNDSQANYEEAVDQLVLVLHYWFQHETTRPDLNSSFSLGDTDIFIQASPLTRSLLQKLDMIGFTEGIRDRISSFLGGCGYVQQDLERLSKYVFDGDFIPEEEEYEEAECAMVYALSRSALNFMMTDTTDTTALDGRPRLLGDSLWPRNTQLIMLSEKADLVGGLMDFDLSLVVCSFDGNSVRVAPRAAFSLLTFALVVTPFILEEKRNWQRIVKYYKRGFPDTYILDPNCQHPTQCSAGPFGPPLSLPDIGTSSRNGRRAGSDSVEEITELQQQEGAVFLCYHDEEEKRSRGYSSFGYIYTLILFEKESGEAFEFLAARDKWTPEKKNEMQLVDPRLRVCCRYCRYEYENYAFLKRHEDYGERIDSNDDALLFGQFSLKRQQHDRSIFSPVFYSGGVFDGRHCRFSPHYQPMAMVSLDSQLQAEKARYFVKNSSYDGYLPRYTYGVDLSSVFGKSAEMKFSPPKRNLVGLNPERFISECDGCLAWMPDYEYGTKYCELCMEQKPSAKR